MNNGMTCLVVIHVNVFCWLARPAWAGSPGLSFPSFDTCMELVSWKAHSGDLSGKLTSAKSLAQTLV